MLMIATTTISSTKVKPKAVNRAVMGVSAAS
jgi:hypothetical protein